MEAHRLKIRHYTGHDAPRTCPWRAYEDPTVHAVLALFSECQTPEGCTPALCMLQGDVPHAHWQGLLHYKSCLDSYRRKLHDEERDKR